MTSEASRRLKPSFLVIMKRAVIEMFSPCVYFFFFIVLALSSCVSAVEHDGHRESPALLTDDPKLQTSKEIEYVRQVLKAIDQRVDSPIHDFRDKKELAARILEANTRYTETKDFESIKRGAVDSKERLADEGFTLADILMSLYNKAVSTSTNVKTLLSKADKMLDNIKGKHEENCTNPRSCLELWSKGYASSGVYSIYIPSLNRDIKVYCDQETEGGGWIVFQRRKDGSVDFYRNWHDYKNGFGNLEGEFWLGLDYIHHLTNPTRNELRIDLEDFEFNKRFARYNTFLVGSERSGYVLTEGEYSGNAGDSLGYHNGYRFSTRDVDHDASSEPCAHIYKGAWWYNTCHESNLNGFYLRGSHSSFADGVEWYHWKGYNYSLKFTEMKIRERFD